MGEGEEVMGTMRSGGERSGGRGESGKEKWERRKGRGEEGDQEEKGEGIDGGRGGREVFVQVQKRKTAHLVLALHNKYWLLMLTHLDNFNQDCQFRVVQINNMGKVSILCHHRSQQMDDIITLDHTVVTSLVVDCKLYKNDKQCCWYPLYHLHWRKNLFHVAEWEIYTL